MLCCWAVGTDMLNEDSPHHLSAAQSPAHASASHYADTQGLARRSSQLHSGNDKEGYTEHPHTLWSLKSFLQNGNRDKKMYIYCMADEHYCENAQGRDLIHRMCFFSVSRLLSAA